MQPVRSQQFLARAVAVLLAGFLGAFPPRVSATPGDLVPDAGAALGGRLAAALAAGPVALDALWAPGVRDPSVRLLDARTASLAEWSAVEVHAESWRALPDGPGGAPRGAVTLRVSGVATWRPRAWGIATAFWTLQCDERHEVNHVVRREEWALEAAPGGWRALERRVLGTLEVLEAKLVVDVQPAQDAVLVEGTWYVRSLVDSLSAVRFLLDRRAAIYDFRVDGRRAPIVRGNELGSFGFEGFSPELESSFELPEPLASGEEALITFRIRAPVVHLQGAGFVTSLPLRDGAFRERLWLPVLAPVRAEGPAATRVEWTLGWPAGRFAQVGIASPVPLGAPVARADESASVRVSFTGDVRDLDFVLLEPGVAPQGTGLALRWVDAGEGRAARIFRTDPAPALLLSGRRERTPSVTPLLYASASASQDFTTELQDLLPLDEEIQDELSDDSATDAELGADDRSAN